MTNDRLTPIERKTENPNDFLIPQRPPCTACGGPYETKTGIDGHEYCGSCLELGADRREQARARRRKAEHNG